MLKNWYNRISMSRAIDESRQPFIGKDNGCVLSQYHDKRQRSLQRLLILQSVVTLSLGIGLLLTLTLPRNDKYFIPNELYSPAQSVIKYNTRVFNAGFGSDITRYMGPPTEENRQAWEDLYQGGIVKIPIEQAAKLPVKTVPFPENPGYYVIGIDVFHQLHCLNQLRLRLWGMHHDHERPQHSDNEDDGLQGMDHLDHCVDSIRQSLMCSSDISVIIWQWDDLSQMARPHANVTHTCRDFEAIRNWAWSRRAPQWDQSIHVPDPLRGGS